MLKAGGPCMDLQSLRHGGSSISPCGDSRDLYRRHQILLQRRQRGIGTDFFPRVAALIITTGKSEAGDKERGETRQSGRTCILEGMHHDYAPNRWRFVRALATRGVNTRTMTTSAESIRPVGTTAVYASRL